MSVVSRRLVLLAACLCWAVALQGGQGVSNPGFETGALSTWFQGTDFTGPGEDFNVINTGCHDSSHYCVTATGNKELRQNFTPIPSSWVTEITFWIKHPNGAIDTPVEVWLFYDGSPSSGNLYHIDGAGWRSVDVTSQLVPGRLLKGIAISGYGDSGSRTYIDDVSIVTTEPPVLSSPSSASNRLYFAQLADGGTEQKWTTTVMLVNPSVTTSTSVTMTFYDNDGAPLELDFGTGLSSTLTLNLRPGGTTKLTSTGARSSIFSGWALAMSDIPITGTVLYQASANGVPKYGVAAAGTGPTFYYNSFGTEKLGVALANPSSTETIHLLVVAKDQSGADAASKQFTLDPRHHVVFHLDSDLGLPPGFLGNMTITSNDALPEPFVAWALHADVEKDLLSPLPPGEQLLPTAYERKALDAFARVRAAAGPVLRTIAADTRNFKKVTVGEIMGYLAPMSISVDPGTTIAASFQTSNKTIHISQPMLELLGGADGALAFLIAREVARGVVLITGQPATDIFLGVTNPEAAIDMMALLLVMKAGYDPSSGADFYGRLSYVYLQQIPIDAGVLTEFSVPNNTGSRIQDLVTYTQANCDTYPALGCQVWHNLWHPHYPGQIP